MKKFLMIVYPIIVGLIVIGVVLFTGNHKEKIISEENNEESKIDFTYAAGSMLSKEDMTEEEMKMHDAKVIQYGLYQAKELLKEKFSYENCELMGVIAQTVKSNLFYSENPKEWLHKRYTLFVAFEMYADGINFTGSSMDLIKREGAKRQWEVLGKIIEELDTATDNYIGMSFEERARNVENHEQIKELIDQLNDENVKVVYRNPDNMYEYIIGWSPEPTRETILFCAENTQKLLNLAPLGDLSTLTPAEIYINQMPQYFVTMLEDYDGTRYNPRYKDMGDWSTKHNRLFENWNSYYNLVSRLKEVYNVETES